ncbi:MAG: hypothetical protein U0992_08070 [Planctomycetaceae bacterium]
MTDVDPATVDAQGEGPPPRRRRWWKIAGWALFAFFVLRIGWAIIPRSRITIGPETTVISEPLTPEGFVDFAAAVNARCGAGVTSENNAAVLLLQAFGPGVIEAEQRERYFELLGIAPLPEAGAYFVDEAEFLRDKGLPQDEMLKLRQQFEDQLTAAVKQRWTDDEFPLMTEFLAANERPLERIREATQRTRHFSPIAMPDAELLSAPLEFEQQNRWGARLLLLSGMRRLGQGDVAGAWSEVLACYRLGRLMGQSPILISVLISYALENSASMAAQSLIRSEALTAEQARQFLADLDGLAPIAVSADVADFGERLTSVDTYCRIAMDRYPLTDNPGQPPKFFSQVGGAFDWNLMLRQLNRQTDRNVAAMRIDDARARQQEFAAIDAELTSRSIVTWQGVVTAALGLSGTISQNMNNALMRLIRPAVEQFRNAEMRTDASLQLTRIGFALAAHQREHGAYPASLSELAPGILAEVPVDPCGGGAYIYKPADGGFLLYSVGANLQDDGGRSFDDNPKGDDLVLRVGGE